MKRYGITDVYVHEDNYYSTMEEMEGGKWVKYEEIKALQNLIRDMLFDIPVIPERHKYVERLQEIKKEIDK